MTEQPPFSDAEIKAGLDCVDEPWPPITMERRFLGLQGQAWTRPYLPWRLGGQQQVYVPGARERGGGVTRYYLGIAVEADDFDPVFGGWVWAMWPDGRWFLHWGDQLLVTPWGEVAA